MKMPKQCTTLLFVTHYEADLVEVCWLGVVILSLFCVDTSHSKGRCNSQTFQLPYGSPFQWQ